MEGLSRGSSRGRCQVLLDLDPRVVLTRVAVDPHVISRFEDTYLSPAADHTHQGKSPSADVSIPAPPVGRPMRATPLPLARETIVRETNQGNSVKSSKRMRKLSLKRNSKSKLFSEVENSAAVEASNVYLINPITLKSEVPVAHRNSSSLNNGYSSTYSTPTKSTSDPSTRYSTPIKSTSDPSTRYSTPTKSTSDPSTRYSTPTKSTSDPSLFESPSTFIGPLTTNSLLTSPNVALGSDFDGITDWFDFEDQIQTATKQLAIEPHESSKHITSEQLTNHPAAVPHFIEDAAHTPTPAVTISPDTSDLSMAANNTDTLSKIRKKEKSRKHFMKIKPPITLDSFGNPIKRKRGRPRKHPLIVTGQPFVKIEPHDVIQPHPLLAEPATKNKKKKQDKAAAQLITQVFGQGWEKRKFHNQTTAEDQGYYTCISGSDSSSRSSHIPVSHSPVGNMLSPDFTSRQPCVLIQDPILLGQEPVQNQDISVSVLESGQCDGQAALPTEPSDVELIRQLDALLSNEGAHILDDMIIGETQEVTTYEDEEAVLSSKSVTGCLVELQQCGRITGATRLVSKQGTKMKQCKGPKVKRLVTNTKAVAPPRPRRKSTPSMVNSRTKSGRTIKPTARMMDFNCCTNTSLDDSQPDQGGSNESEEDAPTPIKLSSTVNDDAHTKAPPVPPRVTHIDPKLKLKLKDLRLSIPRSPITQRLGSFSFKLPKLSSLVTTLDTSCARIVTIESSPPPAPKQGVAFKDSSNPPTMMPPSTEAMTPSTPSNTLSMSLDAILREMDQSKAAEQMMSDDARLVTVKPVDPPIFQRLDSERMVRFTSPNFDGSLTDNDISDLFSPLDVETSLEQVLQGDGLFGPEPADNGPSRVVKDASNDVSTASPVKIREVRFKLEGASEGLPAGDDESVIASTAEEPFTFNLSPCNSFDMDSDVVATHPIQGESPDEDAIDLHADDFDMFDSDVKDTPLAGILFKRPPLPKTDARVLTAKTAPTPPPWRHKQRPPHTHPVSPKQGGSSPGYNHPPALMPYKKEQVSQWVAEAQRQIAFCPPTPHRALHAPGPFDPSWVLNRNGNSSNERLRFDEPPLRPTSPAGKPQGGKDLFPRSLLGGHCLFFLRGRCDFNNCRFRHTPLNLVPLHILEVASFQGTPVDSLPVEVLYHYGNDPPSCSQLLANWTQFTDLIHGLLYKSFGAVFVACQYFSFSVQFTPDLLRRILELCSLQPPSTGHHGNPLVLADNIFAVLRKRGGRLGRDICYLYLKTISNFDVPLKLMEAYKVVRSLGEPPNYDILVLMLRLSKTLGQRVFDLLEDIDKCVPPLTSMEAARCVNRLIDIADGALLLKHINQLGRWLEHTSLSIISKITGPAFTKLSTLFTQEKSWSPLLTLYHSCPKYASTLEGSQISEALHTAVTVLGPSDKMADILSNLCDEQLAGISSEVWNRMITDCAEKGKVQRARRFYRVAVTHKKQFSVHTSSALLRLLMSQGEHSEAVGVLRQCLETTPLAPPPLSLLAPLCDVMDTPSDLQLVIKTLIVTNTTPPPAVLQSLLNAHSKQKAYQRLAEVVKLSLDYNMVLDKLFYQKVLVELRQWGRDQDAISTVYKALRTVENLETSDEGFGLPVGFESPPSPPPWPPTGGSSSPSVPTARTTKTLLPTPIIPPNPIAAVSGGCVAKAVSLENMMKASSSQDQSSLIKLIEVNGSLGQFGAVASVLVSFPDSQSHYDNQTVGVVWRAINSSSLRTANAFSNLLSALAQSRSHAFSTPPQTALLPSDRWLVSQIGIAILKIYEAKEDWQSGFVVLHYLHRYGIHYVKLSEPSANLPPCSPVPPTPCTVALSAINVCMHMDQVNGALEVLQGCEWIQASNTDELLCRTKLLTEMVEKFLHLRDSQNAWKCLLAIDSRTVVKNYQHAVTNLHNKLLQTLLSSKDVSLALSVYQVMRTNKLQCLPVYFSCLLHSLCNDHQELVARELCKNAISESCYCGLSGDNLLQVTLPAGLVRLELHLLLEDHLRRVVQTVGTLQPLLVQFNTGSRSHLEQVFSTDFDPPLTVHFLAKGSSLSLTPSSLTAWASRHNVTKPSPSYHTVPVTPMKAQSITELVGVTKAQATLPLLKASNRTVESHDSASDTLTVCPVATVPGEQCPAEGDVGVAGRRPVRLRRKRSSCDTLPQDIHSPPTKKPLVDKELKHTACQLFINHLKPYYQAKTFKTPNDYKHLIKTLSLKYFKTLRTQEAPLLEVMDTDIAAIVASLMPRVRVYSSDLDHELGLYFPSSNSDDT